MVRKLNKRKVVCVGCGENKEHYAKGCCEPCYRHRNYIEHREERILQSSEYYHAHKEECSARMHEYYLKNKEKFKESNRQWYRKHKEQLRGYKRQYAREYRMRANPEQREKMRERCRDWRMRNPKYSGDWQRANVDKVRVYNARRALRKLSTPHSLVDVEAFQMLEIFSCFYCGDDNKLGLDHFIPLSKGGGTTKANMVVACFDCNRRKSARLPQEVLQQLYLFEVAV